MLAVRGLAVAVVVPHLQLSYIDILFYFILGISNTLPVCV